MKIVELGIGDWTVYAVCSDETTCPVLDFIGTLDPKRGRKILSDLQQHIPSSTPQDWVRADFSWKLRGTKWIYEFRWSKKAGGTPRIYWFYDDNCVIVCAHGVNKKAKTDPDDISLAERIRTAYLEAKSAGTLIVVSCARFMVCDTDEEEDCME
jgi:hypothetical protein